ncbi:MAG: hypothetical protein DRJ40_06435 [Thermoprotei archaeon]|nr:MAG: hypothetical protein DRJ40_06435 [Thermoprotei archaeon]
MAKLVVLVDDEYCRGFTVPCSGLSLYLELDDEKLLVDTGPLHSVLTWNSTVLSAEVHQVKKVLVTCPLLKHMGSLPKLLKELGELEVYTPMNYISTTLRGVRHLVAGTSRVDTRIHAYTVLKPYPETVYVVHLPKLDLVIVGCSRVYLPTLLRGIEEVLENRPLVIGGFHVRFNEYCIRDIVTSLRKLGAVAVIPLHCTSRKVREYLIKKVNRDFLRYITVPGTGFEVVI